MDESALQAFRSLAEEVRTGFREMKEASGELRIIHGYLESKDTVGAYKSLCLPVRRAYKETDRVSFLRTSQVLGESEVPEVKERLAAVVAGYDEILEDLASFTILNDRQVQHREVFDAWLEASVFGDFGGKDKKYRALLDECGKAVEGIAVRLTEAIGNRVLELDELIADVLGPRTG
jgi:hypothetical protein